MTQEASTFFKPPYNLPWRTFINFLDRLAEDPSLPDVIDRSLLRGMSWTAQTAFLSSAQDFGLVDADGRPTDRLHRLVYQVDERPRIVSEILREYYGPIVEMHHHATTQQLENKWSETFSETGDVRRKAISFFLQAANFAGLEMSPEWEKWKPKRSGPSGSTASSTPPRKGSRRRSSPPNERLNSNTYERKMLLELDSGDAKINVGLQFDPFTLTKQDREFVFHIVDLINSYPTKDGKSGQKDDPSASEISSV